MNLKLFFSLPLITIKPTIAYSIGIEFEKIYIYKSSLVYAKAQIINYKEKHTHIFFSGAYIDPFGKEIDSFNYVFIAEQEYFNDKILIKNITETMRF